MTATPTLKKQIGYKYFSEIPAELLKDALIETFDSLSTLHELKDTAFAGLYNFITTMQTVENSRTGSGVISENEICTIVFPIGQWYKFISIVSLLKPE